MAISARFREIHLKVLAPLFMALSLSACIEPMGPPMPTQAMQNLMLACDAGNIDACEAITTDEAARRQEAIMAGPPIKFNTLDPAPFMRPIPQPSYYNGPWLYCMNGTKVPYGQVCPI